MFKWIKNIWKEEKSSISELSTRELLSMVSEEFVNNQEQISILNELSKRADLTKILKDIYDKASVCYKNGEYEKSLNYLNEYLTIPKFDTMGAYVFNLIIEVCIASETKADWAYDLAIEYYDGLSGENEERWLREFEARKIDYEKEIIYMEELRSRYNFDLSGETLEAIVHLERLKVNEYYFKDYSYQDSFSKVYNAVKHEVELFNEGEESPLNKTTCKGANSWLSKWGDLYKSY